MIVRYVMESSTIDDARRRVCANVEKTNTANMRLYNKFKCRTKGAHNLQRFFELPGPTKKIKKDRKKFSAFIFPAPAA